MAETCLLRGSVHESPARRDAVDALSAPVLSHRAKTNSAGGLFGQFNDGILFSSSSAVLEERVS